MYQCLISGMIIFAELQLPGLFEYFSIYVGFFLSDSSEKLIFIKHKLIYNAYVSRLYCSVCLHRSSLKIWKLLNCSKKFIDKQRVTNYFPSYPLICSLFLSLNFCGEFSFTPVCASPTFWKLLELFCMFSNRFLYLKLSRVNSKYIFYKSEAFSSVYLFNDLYYFLILGKSVWAPLVFPQISENDQMITQFLQQY